MFKTKLTLLILMLTQIISLYEGNSAIAEYPSFEGTIVFTVSEVKKNSDQIYIFNSSTQRVVQLTKKGNNLWPKWSPDGKKIAFSSVRAGHNAFEIYIMDADGKNQKRLTFTGKNSEPRWSGKGALYFQSGYNEGIIVPTVNKNIEKGKMRILIIRSMGDYIETLKGVTSEDKDRARRLQDWMKERQEGVFQIFPSPEGDKDIIFYNSDIRMILVDKVTGVRRDLKSHHAGHPAWSKDGKKIAYVNGDMGDYFLIYDVEKDRYDEVKLDKERDAGCGGELSWSRDSKKIIYSCGIDYIEDSSWLYILDVDSKKSIKLIKGNSPDWF